ncbi:MAG: hypothetical protein ACKE51_09025 [Methylococcaceae bacterium]
MQRRTFLKGASATLLGSLSPEIYSAPVIKTKIDWSHGMQPLYCLAYIDPEYKLHKGQESFIAKYPITVIPQESSSKYFRFRKKLAALNPQQKVLAYQITLDENGLRGPGHELLRYVRNSWLTLPGGIVPTIDIRSGNVLKRRIYDPRDAEFRERFVEACQLLVNKYEFDGIFLDNCTIYARFASIPFLGDSLKQGLQQLIQEIRSALPNTILMGNSRYNWSGLNGEMNEGRPKELSKEAAVFSGHVAPAFDMYHYYMKDNNDLIAAEQNFRLALANRCFYGTAINAQTIKWYPFFEKVLSEYEIVKT